MIKKKQNSTTDLLQQFTSVRKNWLVNARVYSRNSGSIQYWPERAIFMKKGPQKFHSPWKKFHIIKTSCGVVAKIIKVCKYHHRNSKGRISTMHSGTFSQLSFKLTSCGMKPKSEDTHEVKLKKQSKQNYSNFRRSEFFVNHFCKQKDIFTFLSLGPVWGLTVVFYSYLSCTKALGLGLHTF